ncbi:hypothetical protein VTN00DRAFT_8029 [Thermoascus crustaceus]|uniref:uncharacterized protein n=1 Tax=Thermoascus crustaceus TaxID=5088 RepID=UPI00374384E1
MGKEEDTKVVLTPVSDVSPSSTENQPQDDRPFEPPDGGVRAWLAVLGCFLLQMCCFGYLNTPGIFQLYYSEVLLPEKSTSQLAWIATLQIFLVFFFGPLIGKVVDALGPRTVIAPFSLLSVFALFMLSLCKEYWQIVLAQGIAFGLGAAGTSLPSMVIPSQWFSTKRGLATGIVTSGSGLGGVIFPIMIMNLFERTSFGDAVRWSALVVSVGVLVANLCCHSPFTPRPPVREKSTGLKVFNHNRFASVYFYLSCFFMMWGSYAPLSYLPEMAQRAKMPQALVNYIVPIGNIGTTVGRILPGWLSDRVGRFNVMFGLSTLSGILVTVWWLLLNYYPSVAGIVLFALVYGVACGGFLSLVSPCVADLSGNRIEELGTDLGVCYVALACGSLTGLPIGGAIKDSTPDDSFAGLILFSGAAVLMSGVCMLAARISLVGWKPWIKI